MKKILSIAVLLMTALVNFTACSNDDENEDPKLALVETSWDFGDLNDENNLFGYPWIITMSRHYSFYDDHTGMFISKGENIYPENPEWNDKYTSITQFTYTFDGTSGIITLGTSSMISNVPEYCFTKNWYKNKPNIAFTLSPDGKTMHFDDLDDGGSYDLPKMAKFDKVNWVEFPPENGGFDDPNGSYEFIENRWEVFTEKFFY